MIPGTKAPFSQEEVHWVEATFFDDVCNESIEFRPRGVSLATPKEDTDMEIDLIKEKELIIERLVFPDGRKFYKL